ncbi:unnamed protein product [Staurois parvus]|uniref:Ig-like domain-containing protein n=1 Tax=Staurois parvus TaxID=386267 RepID=A0ABN9AZ88_9NEOB|nr:unnamed protein product [Staurois parvus]
MTQTPDSISVSPGQTITITCTSSSHTGDNIRCSTCLNWYQQKPGQRPTPIIWYASNLQTGAPDRFSGSGSGTDFTLTIRDIKDEDEAEYCCQQCNRLPFTQWYRAVQKPPSSFSNNKSQI